MLAKCFLVQKNIFFHTDAPKQLIVI
uniref:Uncharacterized protein n=1 Tax=mine drainage metagenome TaxID=410659 RepID=E6QPM4_9ZZZZ